MIELRRVELSMDLWETHLRSIRRGVVLLARLQSGERLERHELPLVAQATRDLRAVADLIEETLGD